LALLCPAGHAGRPQISMPLGAVDGLPIGLSVVADQHRDEDLLQLAIEMI
jgi:amidase